MLLAPALAASSQVPTAPAAALGPGLAPAADPMLPPQGLYEGCAPSTGSAACVARLGEIGTAGFSYVLNYSAWYGSPQEILRYADAAAALGLQLIWPLNHPAWRGLASLGATYPQLGETGPASRRGRIVRSSGDQGLAARAIGLVAGHPATWGFYIGDELPPEEAARIGALSALVRILAPDAQQLYVARPGAARLEPFAPFADVAGADIYPVGSGDPPVRQAAQSTRAVASAAGVRTAIVLQAFSWSQYRPHVSPPLYPSARRLRTMRDAAIHHADPAMILWYSYQDILRSDDPARRWRELCRAALSS